VNTIWLRDAAERVISTFVVGFLGSLSFGALYTAATAHDWHGLAIVLHSAAIAGLAALGSLAKAVAANRKAGTLSPASLAPAKPRRRTHKQAGYGELEALVRVVIALVVVGFLIWLIVFLVHHVH
jgi:hypothetical protein